MAAQEHRAHHGEPIASHYCLLAGVWNRPLDRLGVFAAVERLIFEHKGWRPRSWT